MGFQYVPALIVPQLCIEKRRALAIAIAVGGCPLGSFIFSPALQFLINTYGWRGAILITGAFILNGCPLGLLLNPPKTKTQKQFDVENTKNHKEPILFNSMKKLNDIAISRNGSENQNAFLKKVKTTLDVSILKSGTILGTMFLLWTLFCLGFPVFANFLPLVASSYGISQNTSSLILSIFGFSDFAGRLLLGVFGSFNRINPVFVWCFITLCGGLSQVCLTWLKALPVLCFLAVSFGLSIGEDIF